MKELIYEYRGDVVESIYFGRVCVVDEERNVTHSVGDVNTMTYFRSAAKPIQAIPVLVHGLDKKYNFTDNEIALMCGSHLGEQIHLETVLSMLEKTGLEEEDFIMLPSYPSVRKDRNEMVRNGIPPRKAYHNCSGKHVAIMAVAKELTGSIDNYWKSDHPAQLEIKKYMSIFSEYAENDIKLGIDGCGVPVFAVPLKNIAIAYMKLACPDTLEDDNLAFEAKRLTDIINKHSPMIRGNNQICDIFNRDTNIVAKAGALGVYAFGMKKERLGVASKVENGPEKMWPVVTAEILKQLKYDNTETIKAIDEISALSILNDIKEEVGTIKTVFKF